MIDALLSTLWQGACVVAIAFAVVTFVPQRQAATRYAVWFAALFALALLPFCAQLSVGDSFPVAGPVIRAAGAASQLTQHAADTSGFWLIALWIAGLAAGLMRLAFSYVRIARIVRGSRRAEHLGERVHTSAAISVPIAAGLFHPIVILPDGLAERLDRADLDAVIAHEMAHIRRRDVAGNLIQRVVESTLFFNPWAYVIGHHLVKEREAACDDWAVRSGGIAHRYAACLAGLARGNTRSSALLFTPSAIGSGRMLVGRIARLLDGKTSDVKTNYLVLSAAVVLFALLGFAVATPSGRAATGGIANAPSNCSSDVAVLNPVPPEVPAATLKAYPNAQATVLVTVGADGRASHVKVMRSSGNRGIDTSAADAAMRSTYKPAVRNCKPVAGGQYAFRVSLAP